MAEKRSTRNNRPQGQARDQSRRQFLKVSGAALGGAVVGGVVGAVIDRSFRPGAGTQPAPNQPAPQQAPDHNQALMYFNQRQFRLTEAAVERIFPADDIGPGAAELGVAYYIDHQLAGQWGINAREYMQGPFFKGEPTQGGFPSIKHHELFTLGLDALEKYSTKHYGKTFTELEESQQDDVLKAFESGKDALLDNGETTGAFFKMLRALTLEGVYADPLYGGNKNMMGWRMRRYPGNQMSYFNIIDKPDFVEMEPQSLHSHMTQHS
ncbi:hypothetical protein J6TS7_43050 [Paenibacillus dendritiformis]|nr:hypothetical protein J6TS7_43050 [Paenibacillus dendritiformis]